MIENSSTTFSSDFLGYTNGKPDGRHRVVDLTLSSSTTAVSWEALDPVSDFQWAAYDTSHLLRH